MSIILRTDVTSVKIHENFILAGIGSSVNVFEKGSSNMLQRLPCLNGQKIYGIVPSRCGQGILVFGGKQFTVITSTAKDNDKELFTRLFEPVVCDDWLHSGLWIDDNHVVLLTAHNVVQNWNTVNQTFISQHCSKDNSILYSGLLLSLSPEVLVMAGTVFSEVIVHVSGEEPLHWLEGHKGVIFSISCDLQTGIIVTTSDDRSVRIWGPNITSKFPCDTIQYWKSINIVCKHELYGHSARVMRSCISSDKIISVGEDSAICFWNHDGSLAKKIVSHQNGCIWSVDSDSSVLVTGGGDCAIITHPLTLSTDYCETEILDLQIKTPKKVVFTARRNIVTLNDDDELVFYDVEEKTKTVHKLNHDSTNKLLSISSCKQMVAVANMNGKLDVFIENCKDTACLVNIINTKLPGSKILSMQWAGNRHLVLCLENGVIKVLASKESSSETYTEFLLPNCKERWLTASAVDSTKKVFILGDRCGNIHVYVRGQKNPTRTLSKVHGRYGPTSIIIRTDIITTGRDGTLKYFTINKDKVKLMCSRDLEFKWIEKFLDKEENIVCGFQERVFVVYNIKYNSKLLEVPCGGGHRSWDAIRYFERVNNDYEEFIKLVYLKVSEINIVNFRLSKIISKNIVNGSHSKEINCLKSYQNEGMAATFFITGGEDTTLRISFVRYTELDFEELAIFKHLSSIRTLKTCQLTDSSFMVISAGGRAQICIKLVSFVQRNNEIGLQTRELIDYMIKGTDKMRKGCQNWRSCTVDFDPETRIMDVDYIRIDNVKLIIFAGCSDATLRIFTLDLTTDDATFELTRELKYHKTCILKTVCMTFASRNIVVTCTTRGEVAIWDATNIADSEPIFMTTTNKSGINSFASTVLSNNRLLIVTGGDDNAMHLVLLDASIQANQISIKVLDSKVFDKYHSSQITGLCLVGDFILSTSIDQRIILFKWGIGSYDIKCTFLSQMYSDVADIQGMDLISHSSSSIRVCVFGTGMEVIDIPLPVA